MTLLLIADDEEPTLEILAQVAEGMGYQVLQARDGEEALTLARAHRPNLILTDYMMPRMSGVELMRTVREDHALASTPVILMSAARPEAAREATSFIPKPIDLDVLESTLALSLSPGSAPVRKTPSAKPPARADDRNEMLNWVSHEIKTPLNAARMSAELLGRRLGSAKRGDEDMQHLTVVIRQLDRITSLVNSVLDAASLDEERMVLDRQPVDLRELVERAATSWRETRQDVAIELVLPREPIVASVDEERIRQILDNLFSNAVKYAADAPINVSVEAATRSASIVVRDNGPGIPAAELPHLFDRFRRAEGETRSTGHGLGLYIASSLARLHGGALSVQSVLGKGATFTVAIPLPH